MKHISRFLLLITILLSCNKTHKIKYPITEEIIVTDTYFDTEIQDPYRWMEDDKNKRLVQFQKYRDDDVGIDLAVVQWNINNGEIYEDQDYDWGDF